MESHKRSIAKTITWRVIATIITTVVAFLFTGELAISFSIGLSDTIIKFFSYYFHERIWNKVDYGRHKRIRLGG